jgi:uncharacterized membrane protein
MEFNFDSGIFVISGSSGLLFILAAVLLIVIPPRKINALYGYRTKRSMKSQEAWDFAQLYSAKKMIFWGIILIAFSLIGLLFSLNETAEFLVGLLAMSAGIGIPIYQTEKELKRKFSIDEKNRSNR